MDGTLDGMPEILLERKFSFVVPMRIKNLYSDVSTIKDIEVT